MYHKTLCGHNFCCIITSLSVFHFYSLSPKSNIYMQGWAPTSRVEYHKGHISGRSQALLANIRLRWVGGNGSGKQFSFLRCCNNYGRKLLIVQAPGTCTIKIFTVVNNYVAGVSLTVTSTLVLYLWQG